MAHFEKINFHYSTKNIPICSQNEYKLKLIDKIRNFCRRIRLKVFYCTNKEENESMYENEEKIETFGFKSKFLPKQEEELKLFESDMFDIVRQLKFRRINNKFQEKIQKDVKTIRNKLFTIFFCVYHSLSSAFIGVNRNLLLIESCPYLAPFRALQSTIYAIYGSSLG